tara:strand:+ start:281 stop:403 length:123 start_codon:yes stop_codon:yes gene_type:complete
MLEKIKMLIKKKEKNKTQVPKRIFTAKFDDLDMQFVVSLN